MQIEEPPEPPVYKKKILFLCTPEMAQRLGSITKQYGISRNELMRQLLVYAMDQLESKERTARDRVIEDQAPDVDDDQADDDDLDEYPDAPDLDG